MVEGYKAIAVELERLLGVSVHWYTAYRWARRPREPLPVKVVRVHGARRGRVRAQVDALEHWARRMVQDLTM
jgi:hypothetical protein